MAAEPDTRQLRLLGGRMEEVLGASLDNLLKKLAKEEQEITFLEGVERSTHLLSLFVCKTVVKFWKQKYD